MKQLLSGVYGTRIHLPLSGMALSWRRWSRRRRSKEDGGLQQVTLPTIPWRACTPHRYPRVWESDKANENIRVSELAVLRALAAHCDHETDLIEIGTFDGRTALNLAFSAPGERHMVEKDQSGHEFLRTGKPIGRWPTEFINCMATPDRLIFHPTTIAAHSYLSMVHMPMTMFIRTLTPR